MVGKHYRREELFETVRRSHACTYLVDDNHSPLALQEILLAGCPTVGVRTGAAFVEHGATGYFADRLPSGQQCVGSDDDEVALATYVDTSAKPKPLTAALSIRIRQETGRGYTKIVQSLRRLGHHVSRQTGKDVLGGSWPWLRTGKFLSLFSVPKSRVLTIVGPKLCIYRRNQAARNPGSDRELVASDTGSGLMHEGKARTY